MRSLRLFFWSAGVPPATLSPTPLPHAGEGNIFLRVSAPPREKQTGRDKSRPYEWWMALRLSTLRPHPDPPPQAGEGVCTHKAEVFCPANPAFPRKRGKEFALSCFSWLKKQKGRV